MATVDLAGTIDAITTANADLVKNLSESDPGVVFQRYADMGDTGEYLENVNDQRGNYWVPQSTPTSDAQWQLADYSAVQCLQIRQDNSGGAYDWWKYSPTEWAALRTSRLRFRVTGYFTDSDLAKSIRFRSYIGATYISFMVDGDRLELRDEGGRLDIVTGFNSGAFTMVAEIANNRAKAHRVNSINESLDFGSWDIDEAISFNPSTADLVIAQGNITSGLPDVHGYLRTFEAFFEWPYLAGSIDAQSGADATLTVTLIVNMAGAIDAVSGADATLTYSYPDFMVGSPIVARSGTMAHLSGGALAATGPGAGTLRLVAPNGKNPIRHVPFDWVRKGQPYTQALQVVSDTGHPNPVLWTDRIGWLEVSVDGAPYQTMGATRAQAASLGPLAAGVPLDITLRLTVPLTAAVRTEALGLHLGGGI